MDSTAASVANVANGMDVLTCEVCDVSCVGALGQSALRFIMGRVDGTDWSAGLFGSG